MVCAPASEACPQSGTSVVGVKNRMVNPVPRGRMNAVSDKFISAAMFCIRSAVIRSSTSITPAGLPLKGSAVKASTW